MTGPTGFLRLALDPVRLACLGIAAVQPVDVEDVATRLGVGVQKVEPAVGRLRASGLIDSELRLDRQVLRSVSTQLPELAPAADSGGRFDAGTA